MQKTYYFVNPSGRVPTAESIKDISVQISKDFGIKENYCRSGSTVNDPVSLKDELAKLSSYDAWEIVYIPDSGAVAVLNAEQKHTFIERISSQQDTLTGQTVQGIVEEYEK